MKYSWLLKIFSIIILVEAASFVGWKFPTLGIWFWIIIVFLTFAVSLVNIKVGLGIVLSELVLGGKGYLFSIPLGSFDVSIRLGIFMAVFLAWLILAIKTKEFWGSQYNFRWLWLGFGLIILWTTCVGLLRSHGLKAVFLDANAFLFLGLVPAFGKLKSRKDFFFLCNFLGASLLALALETAIIQTLFNHVASTQLANYYKWIRDTGVGEITYIIGHLYRVFFQSQVYGLLGFFLGISLAISKPKFRWLWTILAGLSAFVIIDSLSRSFWLGGGVAMAIAIGSLLFSPTVHIGFTKAVFHGAIALLIGYLTFMWVLNFPYLWGGGLQSGSLVASRINIETESGASSRQELLPVIDKAIFKNPILGSGFGTSLTYNTKDPRVNKNKNPNGTPYTTTAFELGYNAMAMQFGLPLFLYFLAILFQILKKGFTLFRLENSNREIIAGLLLSLIALFVLHLTTPYLNHPLGLGMIFLSMSAFAIFDPRHAKT